MKLQRDYLTKLGEYFSQEKAPEKVVDPELLIFNDSLAVEIGVNNQEEDLVQIWKVCNKSLETSI